MTQPQPILVTAAAQGPHGPIEEPLPALPIGPDHAQIVATPFHATHLALHDIVELDPGRNVRRIVIKNSRAFQVRFSQPADTATGFPTRRAFEQIVRYLRTHALSWTCHNEYPGVISISIPASMPLERFQEIIDRAPQPLELLILRPRHQES